MAGQVAEFDEAGMRRFFELALWGMLASGYLALVAARVGGEELVDAPSLTLAGAALLARLVLVLGRIELAVPGRAVTALAALYLLFYPLDVFFVSGHFQQATLHLVFFVSSVKLLTAARPRDYLLLKAVAFLELLAASVLSTSLAYFVCLVLFLLSAVATFASHEVLRGGAGRQVVARRSGAFGRRLGALTVAVLAAIVLITLGLFFVLPRTAQAALEQLMPGSRRVSGFASEVTLGQLGELRRNSAAVMHVRFDGERQPGPLKWRGMALGEFNGIKWYNSERKETNLHPTQGMLTLASDEERRLAPPKLTYQVVLHQTGSDWLFVAGRPVYAQVPWHTVAESRLGGFRLPFAEMDNFRYVVYANEADWAGSRARRMSTEERNFYLRMPPVSDRVRELAEQITKGLKSDRERAQAIEKYLRTEYRYSLRALDHEVEDPLGAFLFETRRGHCEYFASAMAVLLREIWVPSRVATGFQSGSYNPLSGWNVIRASDAHSWVEAWLPESGWTTFDPTPPDPNYGASAASRLTLWLDAADMFWQEWVLGYDLDRQLTLAFRVEEGRRSLRFEWARSLGQRFKEAGRQVGAVPGRAYAYLGAGLAIAGLLVWSWPAVRHAWKRRQSRARLRAGRAGRHDAAEVYERLLEVLRKRGVEKPQYWTPREFAGWLGERAEGGLVREFTDLYYALRYGGRTGQAQRMAGVLEEIERLPKQG